MIAEFEPEKVCLEEVYSHADYPRTTILMGHARGVICQAVTGNGNASKLQVQRAVQHHFSLDGVPHPPDVADALAAALCYVHSLGGEGARLTRFLAVTLVVECYSYPGFWGNRTLQSAKYVRDESIKTQVP